QAYVTRAPGLRVALVDRGLDLPQRVAARESHWGGGAQRRAVRNRSRRRRDAIGLPPLQLREKESAAGRAETGRSGGHP
ncbi:MAG: hypothetical protein M1482_17780, partial [Chloroflexi bacterium]|nr:hypothetical protein [Chloroflexota bacterium]